jgi:polysaccharide biosynthesis transport protein
MSLSALSRIVWARKLTFLTVFFLITASAVALSLLVTPLYQSEAMLMTSLDRAQRQQPQLPDTLRYQINSQIYIINSEDVLRQAIAEFEPQKLFPDLRPSHVWWPKDLPFGLSDTLASVANVIRLGDPEDHRSDLDLALQKVKKRLAVSPEKDSQILALTFRHEDPKVAEQFLSLVVRDFLQRQADLSGNSEAPSFFRHEAARYREEYQRASSELNKFARAHSTYSVSKEIELALTRRDDTVAALEKTRGSIAEKEAQAATYQNTLTQLRRRISLPGEVTGPKYNAPAGAPASGDALTDSNKVPANESPLLLVRVFQETAQSLVNLNSGIVGLHALETAQSNALSDVEKKLRDLSAVEAEFGRLKSELDQVSKFHEAHVARAAEAQMNADWDAREKLSSVKVVQSATTPTQAVFPPKPLLATLGAGIGLLGGAATCALIEAIAERRRRAAASAASRQDLSDERFRDWREPESDNWGPSHGIVDYRIRR